MTDNGQVNGRAWELLIKSIDELSKNQKEGFAALRKEVQAYRDETNERLLALERWRWIQIGALMIIGSLLGVKFYI